MSIQDVENPADRPRDERPDRGQAAVLLVIVVVALATAMTTGLAQLGVDVRDRARAESAADAAALAALDGSTLVSWAPGPGPDGVTVVVRVGEATARASATDRP